MSFFENIESFHFLRPVWLLGLLILPVIFIAMRKRALSNSDWSSAIDPALLQHLLPSSQQRNKQNRHFGMIAVLAFAFIAMAGPAWQEKPQEVVKLTDNVVVILDLSISMLATDIAPDRLTRSKQKLQDLLKLRKEGNTALIAFSGDSHVVTPLTDDTKTIIANLPALDPFIMPVIGSRPDLAIKQALALLKQGKVKQGRIVLLTDSVEAHHIDRINETLAGTNTILHVLATGTAAGGPIKLPEKGYLKDEGSVVIPKTDFNSLATLANQNSGRMIRLTLDDKDLEQLDIDGSLSLKQQQEKEEPTREKGFDAWEDMGYLLILLMIPLVLRAHRQGVMLQVSLLLSLFILPVEDSSAFEWNDLWQTQDQQAQKLVDEGNFPEAAERFNSLEHKANANYKAKKFEQASAQYAESKSNNHLYNQGNALAQQQKFEEAIKSYDEALALNPDNEDAQYNKALIEEFLKQQSESSDNQDSDQESDEQDQQDQQDQESKDQESKDQENKDQSEQENKDKQSSQEEQDQDQKSSQEDKEQQEKEQQEKEQQEQQEQSEEEKEAEKEKEAKASTMPEPDDLTDEERQSYEQWMRRVPDDPGGLLRRKFEQQSRERNREAREAGEPIW
jgi:Ca-activated chloride channel family protein